MKLLRLLSMTTLILALGVGVTSCNNVSDEQIQNNAQERLNADPDLTGVMVTVQNRVATLNGIVDDEATKTYAESTVSGVENVATVINQIEVIQPSPDYTTLDNSINTGLNDALNEYQDVTANVENGVITIRGQIRETDRPTIMERLNALNPVQIIDSTTVR